MPKVEFVSVGFPPEVEATWPLPPPALPGSALPAERGGASHRRESIGPTHRGLRRLESQQRLVSNAEKYAYVGGGNLPILVFGLLSAILLLVGLTRFAFLEALLFVAVPFVLMNGTYLLLSYVVMLGGSTFQREEHQRFLQRWCQLQSGLREVSVDVFLPVCGEPVETLRGTWAGVRELQWPGPVTVTVLNDTSVDGDSAEIIQKLAGEFGFHALQRPGREFRKAGNLRHAFSRTSGDFILLLDADFRPRPEMLRELLPYLLHDPQLAIVQSPQFFDVRSDMSWVEAGAGFVQELFYRIIQPARDRFGASVCVGSCAVYRRSALAELGGTPAIDHSEDLWTGFELLSRGWKLKYLPIVLAKGLCPQRLQAFYHQQYRWCRGSLSLVFSGRFWKSPLSVPQKLCFFAGFVYYIATAFNSVLTLLPLLIMVGLFPGWVHWNHLVYSLPAVIYTPFLLGWWSVYRGGLHFLTTREISGAAHLHSLFDTIRGRMQDWVVTGHAASSPCSAVSRWPLWALLATSLLGCLVIWTATALAIATAPHRWFHFLPPLMFSALHLGVCWRCLEGLPRFRNSLKTIGRRTLAVGLCLVVAVPSLAVFFVAPWRDGVRKLQLAASNGTGVRPQLGDDAAFASRFIRRDAADFSPYRVESAFPGAGVRRIMRLRPHPADPQTYYAADFTGTISEIRRQNGEWTQRIVADLQQSDLAFLYSFEIHPNFPSDPRLVVAYRTQHADRPASLRISSLRLPPTGIAGCGEEVILIDQQVESTEHLAGDLAFDDQANLLISMGDNQWSLHDRRSQHITGGLFSGILRIDIDQRGGEFSHPPTRSPEQARTGNYFIPNDNPFVSMPHVLEEFWALGLRNPFRIGFETGHERLWIGDVGQDRREQIELATAGSNHQWSYREGTLPFSQSHLLGQPPREIFGAPTPPLHEYAHEDLNTCVIGGEVYTGSKFPELKGRYIFGDNRSGRIWTIDPARPAQRELLLQLPFGKSSMSLVSISTDREGEIFFTNFASVPSIYRLSRSELFSFPQRLSETGLCEPGTTFQPMADFIPYQVAVPLWSDGMVKRRWFRLPTGTQIDNRTDRWGFPAGTLLIKHFEQGADFPAPGAPVETRVLVVRNDGTTIGATYVWNESGTEAILQLERQALSALQPHINFEYQVPGYRDCRVCHNRDNPVLGLSEEQLNISVPRWLGQIDQLTALSRQGIFRRPYRSRDCRSAKQLFALDDASATLEDRVRSYLHANCSFCHHPEGLEHVPMNLHRFQKTAAGQLINQPAKLSYHKIDGRYGKKLIAPGDPLNSAIFLRLNTEDASFSMPYLGRQRRDPSAVNLIREWIESLPAESQSTRKLHSVASIPVTP